MQIHCNAIHITWLKTPEKDSVSASKDCTTLMVWKTFVVRLPEYVADHQSNWDVYVQPLTYAHRTQVHVHKEVSPISFKLWRHPSGAAAFTCPSAATSDISNDVSPSILQDNRLTRLAFMKEKGEILIITAQRRHKYDFEQGMPRTMVFRSNFFL